MQARAWVSLFFEPSLPMGDWPGSQRSCALRLSQLVLCQSFQATNTPSVIHQGIGIQHETCCVGGKTNSCKKQAVCIKHVLSIRRAKKAQGAAGCCWLPLILRPLSVMAEEEKDKGGEG